MDQTRSRPKGMGPLKEGLAGKPAKPTKSIRQCDRYWRNCAGFSLHYPPEPVGTNYADSRTGSTAVYRPPAQPLPGPQRRIPRNPRISPAPSSRRLPCRRRRLVLLGMGLPQVRGRSRLSFRRQLHPLRLPNLPERPGLSAEQGGTQRVPVPKASTPRSSSFLPRTPHPSPCPT